MAACKITAARKRVAGSSNAQEKVFAVLEAVKDVWLTASAIANIASISKNVVYSSLAEIAENSEYLECESVMEYTPERGWRQVRAWRL